MDADVLGMHEALGSTPSTSTCNSALDTTPEEIQAQPDLLHP